VAAGKGSKISLEIRSDGVKDSAGHDPNATQIQPEYGYRHMISFGAPLTIERTAMRRNIRQLILRFTKIIEERVRRYPNQWIHKRWRTQPLGEKSFCKTIK
jgi:lauroyl/myristoyl acyltransferase